MSKDISDEVLSTIRKITQAIEIHSKKLVQRYGLTAPQFILLKAIKQLNSPTISELAKQVNLSTPTVTSILERLSKKQFISRLPHARDKRKVVINLTELGQQQLIKMPPLLQESFVEQFSQLKDWEQTMMLSSLQRLASMMHAERLKEEPVLGPVVL